MIRLISVLQDRDEYAYLFGGDKRSEPWFASLECTSEMMSEMCRASRGDVDFDYLRNLACTILKYGYADSRLILDDSGFGSRTRFSPELVLHLGLHNVGVFDLTIAPTEEREERIQAFLLAGFYDAEICNEHFEHIKRIFYTLAQRDVFMFTRIYLAERTSKLRRQRELLESIGGHIEVPTFIHELKNPVGHAIIYAQDLIAAVDATNFAQVRKKAEVILAQSRKAMSVIMGLRDVVKPGTLPAETLRLGKEVASCLKELKGDLPVGVKITEQFPRENVPARFNRLALSILLGNLVHNAVEAMCGTGSLHVEVSTEGNDVILLVEDSGPGVPSDRRKSVFGAFNTTKVEEGGVGLGLFICRQFVDRFGGSIYVEDSRLGGARFVVRLDRAPNLEIEK